MRSQPKSMGDMVENALVDGIDIMLVPVTTSDYLEYSKKFAMFDLTFQHSVVIDFFEMSTFVSKIHYGTSPLFQFMETFQLSVWSFILFLILILSIISSVQKREESKIIDYYFNYFTLMFSKTMQHLFLKFNSKMILCIWMLSANYLALIFTAYFFDYMIRAPPVIKIDNLLQLAKREDVSLITRIDTTLVASINFDQSEMAQIIKEKMITYDFSEWKGLLKEIGSGLRNGSLAFSDVQLTIILCLIEFMGVEELGENEPKLTDMLHISEETGGLEPYFVSINDSVEKWLFIGFNEM